MGTERLITTKSLLFVVPNHLLNNRRSATDSQVASKHHDLGYGGQPEKLIYNLRSSMRFGART